MLFHPEILDFLVMPTIHDWNYIKGIQLLDRTSAVVLFVRVKFLWFLSLLKHEQYNTYRFMVLAGENNLLRHSCLCLFVMPSI